MTAKQKYRVIQWATGNIGSRAMQRVIEHPDMELVGLWVSSPDKVGKDAGALLGLVDTGIKATNSVDEIVALDADCVLYMPQGCDWEVVCRLLASGKNVVSTRGEFHNPAMMAPDKRAMIEAACQAGGTSIHSTGSSPGFSTEVMPIALTSIARRLDCFTIDEYADCSSRNSPEMLFEIMGFGKPMGPMNPAQVAHLKHDFGNALGQTAAAMGIAFDELDGFGEFSATTRDVEIAAGLVPKGTVGAMRTTIEGKRGGKCVLRFRCNWFVTTDIEATDWDLRESGWRFLVEGDTPLKVDVSYPVSAEEYPLFTPGLTAHRPVNAIPVVCAAAPGIRTTADLPQVIAQFGGIG
jgi:4-hydroxy-tetrahydrodipicolinate reductase